MAQRLCSPAPSPTVVLGAWGGAEDSHSQACALSASHRPRPHRPPADLAAGFAVLRAKNWHRNFGSVESDS